MKPKGTESEGLSMADSQQAAGSQTDSANGAGDANATVPVSVSTSEELKEYLLSIRDRMSEGSAASIFVLTAMNQVLRQPNLLELITPESKEIARDVWLRLKQAGLEIKAPPALFAEGEIEA